jgi:site-specific recombinase XerD
MEPKQAGGVSPLFPTQFQEALAEYERECVLAGLRPTTIKNRRQHLPTLLKFLHQAGVEDLCHVRAVHLSDFLLAQCHHRVHTVAMIASITRCFLRFLHRRGILADDLTAAIPKVYVRNYTKIPAIWTEEQVEKLLAQVDRGCPQGKRDYAILLLAVRLGMRVGDIVQLRLEHLRWEEGRIELPQAKTRQPLVLPLTEEMGWALIDYLRHGRPAVSHREVFLSCQSPFPPFVRTENLMYIVSKYRRRAGIFMPHGQKTGMHSLRHTLASRLLNEGTPLPTIADILGHASSESARVYTKVDLVRLRACAIDPDEGV